ncbi:MAG: ACT domain-containing protein [Candidatus Micrarchaeota archaeon]
MREVLVLSDNKVGTLANVSEALGSVGVNIEAISAYEKDDKAVFRIVTKDSTSALKVLSKIPGVSTTESDILILKMMNRPGELGKITRKLSNRGVDLESLYILSKRDDFTEVAIKPSQDHFGKAREVLKL